MAFDAFVKIDGIEGESSDDKHGSWIEIETFNWGVSQTVSRTASSSGGASAERADFANFAFSKKLDKASPKLALACADGTHIGSIVVEFCRAGQEKVKFMEYKMTNCIICSVNATGGDGHNDNDVPNENIRINYGKMEWAYTVQKRKGGGAAGNVAGGWDLEKNCKV